MKQGIANIWLLALIIGFIFMFTAYITITLNYTASFKMKNEVLKIIEKKKGVTNYAGKSVNTIFDSKPSISGGTLIGQTGTIQTINLYLLGNAYTATGYCPTPEKGEVWIGINEINEPTVANYDKPANKSKKYYYCITKIKYGNKAKQALQPYSYKVRMFYKFEVPILTDFFSVKVEGKTMEIVDVQDNIW